jgi:hypothetical protein
MYEGVSVRILERKVISRGVVDVKVSKPMRVDIFEVFPRRHTEDSDVVVKDRMQSVEHIKCAVDENFGIRGDNDEVACFG